MDKPTVVRVSKTEFELSDGQIFPHFAELEDIPTVEALLSLLASFSAKIYGKRSAFRRKAKKEAEHEAG